MDQTNMKKIEIKKEIWNELTDTVENLVGRTIILGDLMAGPEVKTTRH